MTRIAAHAQAPAIPFPEADWRKVECSKVWLTFIVVVRTLAPTSKYWSCCLFTSAMN